MEVRICTDTAAGIRYIPKVQYSTGHMEGTPRAVGNLAGKEKNDTKKQKTARARPARH